jgi:hypothetical protein
MGVEALVSNTSGAQNTATGSGALLSNTTGTANTVIGYQALLGNIDGFGNTATGYQALQSNTSGTGNTATGIAALSNNTVGGANTAVGFNALVNNTDGSNNTAIGNNALGNSNGDFNVAVGTAALSGLNTTGNNNVALGRLAGTSVTTASNVICIGALVDGEDVSNHTYIGNIKSTTVSGGNADFVTVDLTTGLLGHLSSSRRYKENIQPMNDASEALYRLKPVTYHYKKEIDRTQTLDYGLVAEEVADVDPSLAIRDGKGQIESVRYTAVNAMLLNEFLKEHRTVQEQGATIAELKKEIASLTTTVREQAGQIQKVSARVELTKPVPRITENRR